MKFKTLYKQNSNGSIQQWNISVKKNVITTIYGQVDGKLQTTIDIVKEGKNLGRTNATTPVTQAQLEAQSAYDAKIKEGYVPDLKIAETTKNTLDAVEPMLAHTIENKEKYVTFPALAQPKLDGLRCLAIMKNGKVKLYSRTQKEYITVPHIVEEIEKLFGDLKNFIADGELYNHQFKHDFNRITSLIKREDVHQDHELVQYYIYDVIAEGNWKKRTSILSRLSDPPTNEVGEIAAKLRSTFCFKVETVTVNDRDMLEQYQRDCIERGYEGCMYRHMEGPYEHKRSKYLLKVKTFQDSEFKVVDVEEGKGKLMGRVGCFICELSDGRTFRATPAVSLEMKETMWQKRKDYIGRQATVKYQNLTPDGVPRFPIWKALRDE